MSARDEIIGVIALAIVGVWIGAFAFGAMYAGSPSAIVGPAEGPCFEDAAYLVIEDHDAPGLRWGCVALDDLHGMLWGPGYGPPGH